MLMMPSDWITSVLVCLCVLLIGIYVYVTRNFNYWKKFGVKEIKPIFPFGNIASCLFLKTPLHEFIDQSYKKGEGERMIGLYVLDKPYLMLRDPELLKYVYIKDFNLFSNKLISDNKNDPFGSSMLFLAMNPPWKFIRQKMTPMFTLSKLKRSFDLMLEICKDLDEHLDTFQIDDKFGKTIEVTEISAKLMTDIVGMISYNIKFNSLTDPNAEFRRVGATFTRNQTLRYFQFLSILFVPALRSIINAKFFDIGTEFYRNTFSQIVDERVKSGEKKADFVDVIIEMINKEEAGESDEPRLGRDGWLSQLTGVFVGGFETTSTTTAFAIYEIATNPNVREKLRDELFQALKETNGKLTYDLVNNLAYLDMVIRETLRIYPVLPWLDRIPDVDYTFPGTNVTVKKGTPILFPVHSMQMDPRFYPNPTVFDPERFSDENKHKIISCTFAPFGEGPRNCIGIKLGYLQVKIAIAHLFSKYEITPCEETRIPVEVVRFTGLMHMAGGLHLNFRKIST